MNNAKKIDLQETQILLNEMCAKGLIYIASVTSEGENVYKVTHEGKNVCKAMKNYE